MNRLACYTFASLLSLSAAAQSTNWRQQVDELLRLEMRQYPQSGIAKIVSHRVEKGKTIQINLTPTFASIPLHPAIIASLYERISDLLPVELRKYELQLLVEGKELSHYTPNALRRSGDYDRARVAKSHHVEEPLVRNLSRPYDFQLSRGLEGKHIALWQSHGRYYEQSLQRWEWQRAKCFQTVEDLFTQSYVLPYLVPMLRNAGAIPLLPREMDTNRHEVIVDREGSSEASSFHEVSGAESWHMGGMAGFANPKSTYLDGENPFSMGKYREVKTTKRGPFSSTLWTPDIPERGSYAVYLSYKTLTNSAPDAEYTIRHLGGETKVALNQRMGGGTWIYVGHFEFAPGVNPESGSVTLSNHSDTKGSVVTADAVKFGGGMGNIARAPITGERSANQKSSDGGRSTKEAAINFPVDPEVSGLPRFVEGSRYWMQWAGFPRSVYSMKEGQNDYTDDYGGRGLWVNHLAGGSHRLPKEKGLHIPVDLAFAFHTDAGTTFDHSTIGTLGIYYTKHNGGKYADGTARMASRDLTDMVMSAIVEEVRHHFEPDWARRAMWDRSYSEARTPEVPTMLLELLSHQNFADMRYGLDPRFRFVVSRAIYKGMLRYLAARDQRDYQVQPLPIQNFSAQFHQINEAKLSWSETPDPLEPSATAEQYILYTRVEEGAFDNGVVVKGTEHTLPLVEGVRYSFRVAALNRGGESFPSEVLSICKAKNERGRILIVNGFNRISAPGSFATKDSLAGFTELIDFGVPHGYAIDYLGQQHEFRRSEPWVDDDAPGFGASYEDWAGRPVAGNNFDYVAMHGKAFAQLGYSYASVSDEAFVVGDYTADRFSVVDLILGKERETLIGRGAVATQFQVFDQPMQAALRRVAASGSNLIVSGAYVGTDLADGLSKGDNRLQFAKELLRFSWRTDKASNQGSVRAVPSPSLALRTRADYKFHHQPNEVAYHVDQPDGIEPVGKEAFTILRYTDTNISAAVAFKGKGHRSVTLGFPIEALKSEAERLMLLERMLNFFLEP